MTSSATGTECSLFVAINVGVMLVDPVAYSLLSCDTWCINVLKNLLSVVAGLLPKATSSGKPIAVVKVKTCFLCGCNSCTTKTCKKVMVSER